LIVVIGGLSHFVYANIPKDLRASPINMDYMESPREVKILGNQSDWIDNLFYNQVW